MSNTAPSTFLLTMRYVILLQIIYRSDVFSCSCLYVLFSDLCEQHFFNPSLFQVRQGLKEYSNWPTYPQLYVKGELIGGLDIIREMHESGELFEELKG